MIDNLNLIPECNVDTAFVEMLGYKNPNHAAGITEVSFILKNKNATDLGIGFIDDDKRKPQYLLQFKCIKKFKKNKFLAHPNHKKYLVVVSPAMDQFIFELCKKIHIKLEDYGLPVELKDFIHFTKRSSIIRDKKFKNLLNTLKQKETPEIVRIKSWILDHSG